MSAGQYCSIFYKYLQCCPDKIYLIDFIYQYLRSLYPEAFAIFVNFLHASFQSVVGTTVFPSVRYEISDLYRKFLSHVLLQITDLPVNLLLPVFIQFDKMIRQTGCFLQSIFVSCNAAKGENCAARSCNDILGWVADTGCGSRSMSLYFSFIFYPFSMIIYYAL